MASPAAGRVDEDTSPFLTVRDLKAEVSSEGCPAGMLHVPGGEFWMGSPRGRGAKEERPQFMTQVASFCMDRHEVTADGYASCVEGGQCTPPRGDRGTCNYGRRGDHPINCVDWNQADEYCVSQGSRLPSELEWEYAARGGEKYFQFSWGNAAPDGRACWKSNQSCRVQSFEAGGFGLHDLSGNVWEWTNDWFGEYPWPKPDGQNKVFRGGGWSHRFGKWLRSTLRNRTNPGSWGSHLGFRCARAAQDTECPFGMGAQPGTCRHGVLAAQCEDPAKEWNGQRCAPAGAPECRATHELLPGHGCVLRDTSRSASRRPEQATPEAALTRVRSPELDRDCQRYQPQRTNAYLINGGNHAARNRYGKELGCKNRDVGVGWNSACCP